MRRRVAIVLGCALLAGCTVGPNYVAPMPPAPASFGEAETAAAPPAPTPVPSLPSTPTNLEGWWHVYGDAELDRLVAIALRESPDVRIAASRIAQARAAERVARAAYLPQVNAQAGTNYERFSKNSGLSSLASLFGGGASGGGTGSSGGITAPGSSIQTYSIGFDASWELDLFGGVTRQVQGAKARVEAAEWNARDAQLSLIAEVADDYLQLRTLQYREHVARDEVDRQQRNLDIMANTAKAGLVAQGDFIRQRAQLAGAEAAVGPIVAEGKARMHALAVLLGRTPDSLIAELAVERPQLPPPPGVPPGLPSELLRRRPDVRAAERNLAAATADVGVAVADLFPRLSLTGMAQLLSTALGNLFTADSVQITGAAQATFPILDFGRRTGAVAQRRAAADEAYFQYRRTVLVALRDVEDALIRIRTEQARRAALAAGLSDSTRAVQAVEARYRIGLIDFGDVLLARQSLLANRDQLAQSEGELRRDLLSLCKALGGGWEGLPLVVPKPGAAAAEYTAKKK